MTQRQRFWELFHHHAPHWAIHRFCSLCRENGLFPKCTIDWDNLEPANLTTGSRSWVRTTPSNTFTTGTTRTYQWAGLTKKP